MPHRSFDHHRIATIAHSADAIQWLCNGQPLDWQDILSHKESNILIRDEETDSHMLFQFRAPCLWEVHLACPTIVRGKDAIAAAKRLLEWFDANIGGSLFAKSYVQNRRVRMFVRHVGFRYAEERDGQAYYERIT